MGLGGDHLHLNFHIHFPHFHPHRNKDIPKGCFSILVGQQGEQQQRFVIPVFYVNHPLFVQLLRDAEDEYGFDQKGPISIPCSIGHFRTLQGIIHHETSSIHHHHHLPLPCFRVSSY